jgi:hypothetical protein
MQFEHARCVLAVLARFLNFAPPKFFLFSRGAKFGDCRLGALPQVICGSPVGM